MAGTAAVLFAGVSTLMILIVPCMTFQLRFSLLAGMKLYLPKQKTSSVAKFSYLETHPFFGCKELN